MAPRDIPQTIETLYNSPHATMGELVGLLAHTKGVARLRSLYGSSTQVHLIVDVKREAEKAATILRVVREEFPDAGFLVDEKGEMTRKKNG
ncbi:MAG TPA: hypothetical protein VMS17_33800 [Gemmataceae bacterium]|nr:hypothetical protein [Gemmataceae bacterium]